MKIPRTRKMIKTFRLPNRPWTVRGQAIEEVRHGTMHDALVTALEVAIVESEYPKRLNHPTTVTVEGTTNAGNQLRVSVTINYQTNQ